MTRKYALTKVTPGDYLLPSNDAQTIWRIRTYDDGPTHGLDWMARDETFWGIWRWTGNGDAVDPDAWDQWAFEEGLHNKRADAIAAAIEHDPRRWNER